MSVKNRADLIAEIVAHITSNGAQAITGPIVQSLLNDLADSGVNMLGDTSILGKLGYSSIVSISNNGDIPHKKYVDDLIAAIPTTPLTQLTWTTEDNRTVIMTIDGTNGIKIT